MQLRDVKPGSIVRSKLDRNLFQVVKNYGDRLTAVQIADVTNPSEWDVLIPRKDYCGWDEETLEPNPSYVEPSSKVSDPSRGHEERLSFQFIKALRRICWHRKAGILDPAIVK